MIQKGVTFSKNPMKDKLAIVETDKMLLFWAGWPSQWTPAKFTVDGIEYNCCEQFLMAAKARLFNDIETLSAIMASTEPREHKALGRQVRDYDDEKWVQVRENVAVRGNLARFEQNQSDKQLLLATGNKMLVEASPIDVTWGIGLAPNDPLALDVSNWRGQNLLGKALMFVRNKLKKDSQK